jgi:hypothetical protein
MKTRTNEKVMVEAEVEMPKPPSYFRYGKDQVVDVKDISEEHLKIIGVAWTENLIVHAANRRKTKR